MGLNPRSEIPGLFPSRSDGRIDLFGEPLRVPPEAVYSYVRATVDVGRERLIVVLDGKVIDQHTFLIR